MARYQGGAMPKNPVRYIDLNRIDHGVLFEGSRGVLVADFTTRALHPTGRGADLTYYQPRTPAKLLPPMSGFQQEWIDACKGNLKTSCDFDYNGRMTELMLLGLVAYRAGKKITYDGTTGRVTNSDQANAYLSRQYRPGWTLDG